MEVKTIDVLNAFFDDPKTKSYHRFRNQIIRDELFAYENKIGKTIFEMSVDEVISMFATFRSRNSERDNKSTVAGMFQRFKSVFQEIFDYYNENYDIVEGRTNIFESHDLDYYSALEKLLKGKPTINFEYFQEIMDEVYRSQPTPRAEYIECAYLLFYCGLKSGSELCQFTENDVDKINKTITINKRVIHLTDRCFELVEKFHNCDKYYASFRGDTVMLHWNNSYLKFSVQEKFTDTFNERTPAYVGKLICQYFHWYVNKPLNPIVTLGIREMHYMGFYDYIVKTVGKERAEEIIKSENDSDAITELLNLASAYNLGINRNDHTSIRRNLQTFVSWDDE